MEERTVVLGAGLGLFGWLALEELEMDLVAFYIAGHLVSLQGLPFHLDLVHIDRVVGHSHDLYLEQASAEMTGDCPDLLLFVLELEHYELPIGPV